ncbi:MAG: homoserine kinase, partial [Acidobacteriota bacterium]
GFDCFGLALQLYLRVTVEERPIDNGWQLSLIGEGSSLLPTDERNLIARVAYTTATAEKVTLPGLHMLVHNDIPLARGLGSSAAAITAGIAIVEAITGRELPMEKFFQYALTFENHADNLAAARCGGFTLACAAINKNYIAIRQAWPERLHAIAIIPDFPLDTESARSLLPSTYTRADTVFNLQHALLLQAALAEGDLELICEALTDRLHQPYRATLVPGLSEALTVRLPGLIGVTLSGSGPTLLALATENFDTISVTLQDVFAQQGVFAQAKLLTIDMQGRSIEQR